MKEVLCFRHSNSGLFEFKLAAAQLNIYSNNILTLKNVNVHEKLESLLSTYFIDKVRIQFEDEEPTIMDLKNQTSPIGIIIYKIPYRGEIQLLEHIARNEIYVDNIILNIDAENQNIIYTSIKRPDNLHWKEYLDFKWKLLGLVVLLNSQIDTYIQRLENLLRGYLYKKIDSFSWLPEN